MEEEYKLWLNKAKESYDDAVSSLENHRYSLTAFCCQQTLEKILKAAVVKKQKERPRKIHDLLPLLRESGLKASPDQTEEIAKGLFANNLIFYWRISSPRATSILNTSVN